MESGIPQCRLSEPAGRQGWQDRSQGGRYGKHRLVHGRTDPRPDGDLCHHGVRPGCRLPGRNVSDQDSLHVDVTALPYRGRLVRRHAAAAGDRLVAAHGDIYFGLWYPIAVALMTAVVGALFLRDTKGIDITIHS